MSNETPVEMESDERDALLGRGGVGVIALSTAVGEPPHSVPVSYGYDAREPTFYFRLSVGPDASKGELDGRPVTFVTYDDADDTWQSVVARGTLEDVERDDIATETLDGLDRVTIPLVDVFESPIREVDFEFYRLVPDELTGRVEANGG